MEEELFGFEKESVRETEDSIYRQLKLSEKITELHKAIKDKEKEEDLYINSLPDVNYTQDPYYKELTDEEAKEINKYWDAGDEEIADVFVDPDWRETIISGQPLIDWEKLRAESRYINSLLEVYDKQKFWRG